MNQQVVRKGAETLDFDVVVVGGGLAGVCAAIAAARNGARVGLVQDRPVLGGNSSSEVRVVPYGSSHGSAWAGETGIVHELILADRATNHEWFFDHGLMNSHYDMVLSEAIRREAGLTAIMNASMRGVTVGEAGSGYDSSIRSIQVSQLGSEREFEIEARHFIDATGDGTVGFLAGADYRYGREARAEFGEPLAPVESDDVTLGSTITMRARKIDRDVEYQAPEWIAQYTTPADFVMDRRLYHIEKDEFGGYWWLEVNTPFHQIDDNAAIKDELHRHVLGVWNYLKNHSPDRERLRPYVLDWIGMIPGKRESRRLVGDVIVTEHDTYRDSRWYDEVAYAGWWIDLHIKGGINNREAPGERENIDAHYSNYIRVAPFSLPLRAFYSRNIQNLWMTGRSLSTSHVALGPVRVQVSLGAQGQAVGTAAALAASMGITPRELAAESSPHVGELQQLLLRQDARLLGVANRSADDRALGAEVRASSTAGLEFPDPDSLGMDRVLWRPLTMDRAQVIPVTADSLDSIQVYVRNTTAADTGLRIAVQQLDRIWDRDDYDDLGSTTVDVAAGFVGWVSAELETPTRPDTSYRVVLRAAEGLEWALGRSIPTGTVAQYRTSSPGGPEAKNADLEAFGEHEVTIPAFVHWRQERKGAHAIRVQPVPEPYAPRFAVDGWAAPGTLPHLWISEPVGDRPEWLEIALREPAVLTEVMIAFDSDLDLRTDQRPAFHRAPRVAADWRLLVSGDGRTWREVARQVGNVQRRVVVSLAEDQASTSIRVEIDRVNGAASGVGIYEVRAYGRD